MLVEMMEIKKLGYAKIVERVKRKISHTRAHCILASPTITPVCWRPSLALEDHPRLLLEHLRKEGFFVKPSLPRTSSLAAAVKPRDFSKSVEN